jgi:transcriptional regulator with XRE-family HTH domain
VDEKEPLGSYLKKERESKKISLREVAKNTRVREHILRAIEEDQHELLPPPTYVKGFVFAYAKFLRLDPNEVLQRYERTLKGEPVPPPSSTPPKPKQKIPPPQAPKPKRKILWNDKKIWVVGGVIVVSLVAFYFFFPYSFKSSIEPSPEKPVIENKLPPASSPSTIPPPALPGGKPFSIQLKAIEETWVSLQVDGQLEKEITLKPGEGFSAEASKEIRIIVGNAGGLDLVLNGKQLDKFGKSGEVLTLIFNSRGVEVKRPEKLKPVQE